MQLTNSSVFLLRGLELVPSTEILTNSKLIKNLGFINAFTSDKYHENDLECPLYLLFQYKDDSQRILLNDFIQGEYEVGLLIQDYDYPEEHVVLLYTYPDIFKEDYKRIIEGKYSKVSMGFRTLFPETYKEYGKTKKTLTNHVFNRTPEFQKEREEDLALDPGFLDDVELWEPFDEKREQLDINKYLKNDKFTGTKDEISKII
jgi:hypothetical protein